MKMRVCGLSKLRFHLQVPSSDANVPARTSGFYSEESGLKGPLIAALSQELPFETDKNDNNMAGGQATRRTALKPAGNMAVVKGKGRATIQDGPVPAVGTMRAGGSQQVPDDSDSDEPRGNKRPHESNDVTDEQGRRTHFQDSGGHYQIGTEPDEHVMTAAAAETPQVLLSP